MPKKSYQSDVLAALQKAPKGLLATELQEIVGSPAHSSIAHALSKLRERHLVRWVLDPGFKSGFRCRWFTAERAPAQASDKNPGDARTQQRARLKLQKAVSRRPSAAMLDPSEPADYSRAKRTVAGPIPDRFALPPGTRIVGGFASMGIGRYLEA